MMIVSADVFWRAFYANWMKKPRRPLMRVPWPRDELAFEVMFDRAEETMKKWRGKLPPESG